VSVTARAPEVSGRFAVTGPVPCRCRDGVVAVPGRCGGGARGCGRGGWV